MALPLIALVKLKAALSSRASSPMLICLLCPFLIKLSFSFGRIRRSQSDLVYAMRLFFFQLGQIVGHNNPHVVDGHDTRWERALRLVYQRVVHARAAPTTLEDETSLYTLSMLAL